MSRGIGGVEFAAGLPDPIRVLAALVTALGDVWFVFGLLGLLYWFGTALPGPLSLSRPRAAFAVALALGGLAVTTALKELFGLPRPPGAADPAAAESVPASLLPVYTEVGAASGFGFPSGHAVSAVVVYGGLGLLVGSRRSYAAAATLCVLLSLSRVLLGVHYLVDIAAGLAVGAVYLFGVYRLCGRGSKPGRAMLLAFGAALVAGAVGYTTDTMLALGGALGARLTWGIVGEAVAHGPTTAARGALATAVGLVFTALFAVVYGLETAPYVSFLGMAVVVSGVVAAPLAGEALARRIRVGRRA
ncbi:probable PAP2-type phosphatase [Natronomonas moolapensis 8.8.11]|uniref:Probable PAP2-type phosphatase n=1 Tax=Natronomonas moolapensis (strain DSM 18674 / CECT 7526 / JCM 14361 / 8.8.11) TaxID=268739 RepID=M1XNX6_NATM8|nr:phosphatase PAP2 family protein [Natronomonas moolapensis]CCQ35650.1 probable PAP2-type phosphatase [Natronomonas moolapensis 8.8.11]